MSWLWLLVACGESSSTKPASVEQDLGLLALSSVVPSEIGDVGGERVVVYGTGFVEDIVVRINGVDCASTYFASSAELACVTPPAEVGEGTISVERFADEATAERPIYVIEATVVPGEADTASPVEDSGTTDDETDVTEDPPADVVEYCNLQYPCSMALEAGAISETVYGRIYAAGVTDREGPGENLQVALGVGAVDEDPSSEWSWTECEYNTDIDGLTSGDIANDEFMGTFEAPTTAGTYRYTVRARIGDGPWTLCDFGESCATEDGTPGQGTNDGFDVNATGVVTVTTP